METKHFIKKTILSSSIAALLSLYGCSSSDNETFEKGVFIDAPVAGLEFSSASGPSGTTDENGEFEYKAGEDVTFKVAGVDVGTVPGSAVIPVLNLPNGLVVARLLQSIDTDALEDLIDINKIEISDAEKAALKDVIEGTGTLDDFFATHLFNIQEATKAKTPSLSLDLNAVSEEEANEHIKSSLAKIAQDLTTTDLDNKVFISKSGDGEMFTFKSDGTGTQYEKHVHGDHVMVHTDTFSWSISAGKLTTVSDTDNSTDEVSLLSSEDNKYIFSTTDDEGELETRSSYQAKSLKLADLDGKILSLDTSDDSDCSASTVKFMGNTASLKESCGSMGHIHSETVTLMEDANLAHLIHITGTNEEDGAYMLKLILVKGDVNAGSFGIVEFDAEHTANNIEFVEFEVTESELASNDDAMSDDMDDDSDMGMDHDHDDGTATPTVTADAVAGKSLYGDQGCSASGCHGVDPALNQNNILHGVEIEKTRAAINNNKGGMMQFMDLTDEELQNIAAYLQEQQDSITDTRCVAPQVWNDAMGHCM